MPKVNIDYSNTIIYKIYCNDKNINETYVGHTTNFIKRKYQHKSYCNGDKQSKMYDIIRQHGGWDNWNMVQIACYNCKDSSEAKIREQEHYELLKPSINTNNINVPMDDLNVKTKQYICDYCNFITSDKSLYERHTSTEKHKKYLNNSKNINYDNNNNSDNSNSDNSKIYQCTCGKKYKYDSGYYRHKKTCNFEEKPDHKPAENTTDKELILMLVKQNTELMEILKNGVNNTTNNTNANNTNTNCMNNNKTFNLQFFLNETCKNAMNINDFVESIKIQISDLEKMGEVGYIEGLSNIITSNLKVMDITERPVHCTDKKRETIYIKDNNIWEKEDDNRSKLRKVIKRVAAKNYKLLPAYREKYPGCQYAESKHGDKYNKMMVEIYGGEGNNEIEKEDKIIRNISKNITI